MGLSRPPAPARSYDLPNWNGAYCIPLGDASVWTQLTNSNSGTITIPSGANNFNLKTGTTSSSKAHVVNNTPEIISGNDFYTKATGFKVYVNSVITTTNGEFTIHLASDTNSVLLDDQGFGFHEQDGSWQAVWYDGTNRITNSISASGFVNTLTALYSRPDQFIKWYINGEEKQEVDPGFNLGVIAGKMQSAVQNNGDSSNYEFDISVPQIAIL